MQHYASPGGHGRPNSTFASSANAFPLAASNMKLTIVISLLFVFSPSFSQERILDTSNTIYNLLPELRIEKEISFYQIHQWFKKPYDAYEGVGIKFDSANKYSIRNFSCFGGKSIEEGTWKIVDSKIILISKNSYTEFDLVKYDNHYLLVNVLERRKFASDFLIAKAKCKSDKFSSENCIYLSIEEKYYSLTYERPSFIK